MTSLDDAPDLRSIIDKIQIQQDCNFLFACGLNLYSEALRRRAGRILYGPKDVENLLHMVKMLLDVRDPGEWSEPSREAKATEEELAQIADPGTVAPTDLEDARARRRV